MVDLKAMPFYLDEKSVDWVERTIKAMTLDEKIGQLFIHMNTAKTEADIEELLTDYPIGGIRFLSDQAEKIHTQNNLFQKYSKIPVFVAANLENGANGVCKEGTIIASHAQCGASESDEEAYQLGRIAGKEAALLGCNWNFGPITDLALNWRNSIINTRSFSNDPEKVINRSKSYIRGIHESKLLACSKHFPGDGVDDRDQHLLMSVNDLTCDQWDDTFGKVYKSLIEDGLETMMIGHIALPAYERYFDPSIKNETILPATLSKNIVTGLLRERLNFNGLIVTDASHMMGLLGAKPRNSQVPEAIAAGCDMFLFVHDIKEDFRYMKEGYENGIITPDRLEDALKRILGMKAKLGLHNVAFSEGHLHGEEPVEKYLNIIGSKEHKIVAERVADSTITLVKDSYGLLPIDPKKSRRARLYYIESHPGSLAKGTDPVKWVVKEELENAGFTVDINTSFYDLECQESSPMNQVKVMHMPAVEAFKASYDVVFVFVHMSGYAQENNVGVKYSATHSNEIPWWVCEVPTICVSLNFTNHLYDLPMMKTFINAYVPSREAIRMTIQKIIGKSTFKGSYSDTVWCDRWDTRI